MRLRLALWTDAAAEERGWPARLLPRLGREAELTLLTACPARRPPVDLDVYRVADDAALAFVYDALLDQPGLVVLEAWNLHALVFAATAGRGEVERYRLEARRQRGATGEFVARQVLQGTGGALPQLLPLNGRVLEAAAALVATRGDVLARAAPHLAGRLSACLPLDDEASDEASARALVALARGAVPRLSSLAAERAARRALEPTPLGRALDELRARCADLGIADLPGSLAGRIAALLPGRAGDGT